MAYVVITYILEEFTMRRALKLTFDGIKVFLLFT
ncbi:hypothetical protein CN959_01735, partial [Bacillus cereus]